jgi:uncharacterized MAPEG superfamily protein
MNELTCLELSVILWLAHVVAQFLNARGEFGDDYLFTPRDKKVTPKGLHVGRATRALHNYIENYAPFLAVDLGLIATGHAGGIGAIGATVWIIARVVYLPLYLMGIKYVRTACWGVSVVGLLMMLWRLAGY